MVADRRELGPEEPRRLIQQTLRSEAWTRPAPGPDHVGTREDRDKLQWTNEANAPLNFSDPDLGVTRWR